MGVGVLRLVSAGIRGIPGIVDIRGMETRDVADTETAIRKICGIWEIPDPGYSGYLGYRGARVFWVCRGSVSAHPGYMGDP